MINLKNVSLVFQGGSVAISNISTKVEEGEFVYLVGHSGSGKSSFLKLLYKEYIATKGEIEVANIDVSKLPKWKIPLLRRKIGIILITTLGTIILNVSNRMSVLFIYIPLVCCSTIISNVHSRITIIILNPP